MIEVRYMHSFDKRINKCRVGVGKRIVGIPKLVKSINGLNYEELLHVSRISNDYIRGIKTQMTGSPKVDGLVRSIYTVSRIDVNKAKRILEKIDSAIVKKNKMDVKISKKAERKLVELMKK